MATLNSLTTKVRTDQSRVIPHALKAQLYQTPAVGLWPFWPSSPNLGETDFRGLDYSPIRLEKLTEFGQDFQTFCYFTEQSVGLSISEIRLRKNMQVSKGYTTFCSFEILHSSRQVFALT